MEAEAGALQDQGQLEQQSEFKARVGNSDLNGKINKVKRFTNTRPSFQFHRGGHLLRFFVLNSEYYGKIEVCQVLFLHK